MGRDQSDDDHGALKRPAQPLDRRVALLVDQLRVLGGVASHRLDPVEHRVAFGERLPADRADALLLEQLLALQPATVHRLPALDSLYTSSLYTLRRTAQSGSARCQSEAELRSPFHRHHGRYAILPAIHKGVSSQYGVALAT